MLEMINQFMIDFQTLNSISMHVIYNLLCLNQNQTIMKVTSNHIFLAFTEHLYHTLWYMFYNKKLLLRKNLINTI